MSYNQHLFHIIIRTKSHKNSIPDQFSDLLYKYINGFVTNKKCTLYRINGIPDHIHLLVNVVTTITFSDFIKDLKVSSSHFLKNHPNFPDFEGWSKGYGSFTCYYGDLKQISEYISNQRVHHKKETFQEEYIRIMKEIGYNSSLEYLFE